MAENADGSDEVYRLLLEHVPELRSGAVEIVGIAREPGFRSIVGVRAIDPGIEPVGVIVGERGSRMKAVVRALSGEKIDVVKWSPSDREYLRNLLSPARITSVVFDDESKRATVFAPSDQIALIVGPQGRRIELVSRLVGWRLVVLEERK